MPPFEDGIPIPDMGRALDLLVVEDHAGLREVTVETLTGLGYRVIGVDSAEAINELPADFRSDIAILDLNLPGEDGLALAARLRAVKPLIGIIMVTARQALLEKLAGYEHGADIYLTKPTAPEELCAAVRALANRLNSNRDSEPPEFALDLESRLLHTPSGSVHLRANEANLLHSLALAPDHTLETWQLLERLGKVIDAEGKAQLQVLVSRLRSKLAEHGAPTLSIRAERGKGYRLHLPLRLK